jgi:dTDP-4-dehydrorhamnose reductase
MRILITGAKGQLGSELVMVLGEDHEIVAASRAEFDVTNLSVTSEFVGKADPDVIIHAAAFTDVDACEDHPEKAFLVNSLGARNVAIAARETGAELFHISTDYVFDGTKGRPYVEFDAVSPLSVYGKAKVWSEAFVREQTPEHFILRTAWMYGGSGMGFFMTMLRLASEKDEISVVDDQRGTPTWSRDVVSQIQALLETKAYGTYHCTSQGACSRYEFALEIFRLAGYEVRPASDGAVSLMPKPESPILNPSTTLHPILLKPVRTSGMPRPAPRPKDSTLDNLMLRLQGLDIMPPWKEALAKYLKAVTGDE